MEKIKVTKEKLREIIGFSEPIWEIDLNKKEKYGRQRRFRVAKREL
jgi:hypothetical protein